MIVIRVHTIMQSAVQLVCLSWRLHILANVSFLSKYLIHFCKRRSMKMTRKVSSAICNKYLITFLILPKLAINYSLFFSIL